MKKNTYIALAILIIVLIAAFSVVQKHSAAPQGKLVTGTDMETFSGTITAVDTGCFSDAVCSVSVDGKKIILATGRTVSTTTPLIGRLIGVDSIADLAQHIGDHANVYATTTPEGDYSIYGDSNYYVEVVKLEQ